MSIDTTLQRVRLVADIGAFLTLIGVGLWYARRDFVRDRRSTRHRLTDAESGIAELSDRVWALERPTEGEDSHA